MTFSRWTSVGWFLLGFLPSLVLEENLWGDNGHQTNRVTALNKTQSTDLILSRKNHPLASSFLHTPPHSQGKGVASFTLVLRVLKMRFQSCFLFMICAVSLNLLQLGMLLKFSEESDKVIISVLTELSFTGKDGPWRLLFGECFRMIHCYQ